jgi:hypothetical protein
VKCATRVTYSAVVVVQTLSGVRTAAGPEAHLLGATAALS